MLYTCPSGRVTVRVISPGAKPVPDTTDDAGYDFIKRQMLHAYKITLSHPVTKKLTGFTAEVPDDFKMALRKLKDNVKKRN